MALDFSNAQNGEVYEVHLHAFNCAGAIEENATIGLRRFEEDGPQHVPIARCKSDYVRSTSFQISTVNENRDPHDILDTGA